MGLFLRYQLVFPTVGTVYSNWLHGHSHIMFLGWVFNALLVGFTAEIVRVKRFAGIFGFLQICLLGMLVAFPLQGYGLFSIAFSTLHTLGSFIYVVLFFRATTGRTDEVPVRLARASLLFFVLASLAPFVLGYLKANGMHHLPVYRFCVYFYLHFQYNGCFFFGVLSLLMTLVSTRPTVIEWRRMIMMFQVLIVMCFPTYFLNILWADPGLLFNVLGWLGAAFQLIALYQLSVLLWEPDARLAFNRDQRMLFRVSYVSLLLKMILQLISALPAAAALADEYRAIVIAYLHVVMVGFITFFLMGWMVKRMAVYNPSVGVGITLLLCGFVGSEFLLAISPWHGEYFHILPAVSNVVILIFSVFMVLGLSLIIRAIFLRIAQWW